MPEGVTYESALVDGRIFMIDNSILEGIPCAAKRFACSPLLVLYCNTDGYLEPLAIQLFSNRAEENPVFTPKDPQNAWLLAKIFFNSANSQVNNIDETYELRIFSLRFNKLLSIYCTVIALRNHLLLLSDVAFHEIILFFA